MKLFLFVSAALLLTSCAHVSPTTPASLPNAPHTTNKTALAIYQILPIYARAAKLSWEPIQKNNIQLTSITRERLTALGIMHGDSLSAAIREFQAQNELKQTGHIDQATLAALNITPMQRYRELVESMNAWAEYPEDENSRYIQVNIPSYQMRLIDHGQEVMTMKAIVGRATRPTPTLSSKMTTIVFNPQWNVPKTILANDVIPGMRANPHYMKEHYDMRLYANWDKEALQIDPASINWQTTTLSNFTYRVTAPPSDVNPLGRLKFIFDNDKDVYMHDTPEKGLFALSDRARSSGCIRLENPMALVEYFYADNTDLNAELVQHYLSTYQTKYIQLRHPIPVYLTYITAWVDRDDRVHFGHDVYG